jgi:hypothetical protein
MASSSTRATPSGVPVALLHLWRIVLLCTALTHEREHPALAILVLIPVNHLLFTLTANLERSGPPATVVQRPAPSASWSFYAVVDVVLYLFATWALVRLYGSFEALRSDVGTFSRTWEWWALVGALTALTILYRPLAAHLGRLIGATGLEDMRLWIALASAIGVWIWCDAVFAAVYQRLALVCDAAACEGGTPFSQPLTSFAHALYFSTITLSTTGYGDVVPVSGVARAIVSVEIVLGFGLLGFLLSRVAGFAPAASAPKDSA